MTAPYEPDFLALVQRAVKKKREGGKLNRQEQRALDRYTADQEKQARKRHYADIPKMEWVEMSGRHQGVLNDQFRRYGIPIGGKTINLAEVARWIHNLLAERGPKILASEKEDETGQPSAIELQRQETARIRQLERLQMEGTLVARDTIHEGLGEFAARLRQLGEETQRALSVEQAQELIGAALDDLERIVERMFGGPAGE